MTTHSWVEHSQCSCLENPRDGATQSRTWLKWHSSSSRESKQEETGSRRLIARNWLPRCEGLGGRGWGPQGRLSGGAGASRAAVTGGSLGSASKTLHQSRDRLGYWGHSPHLKAIDYGLDRIHRIPTATPRLVSEHLGALASSGWWALTVTGTQLCVPYRTVPPSRSSVCVGHEAGNTQIWIEWMNEWVEEIMAGMCGMGYSTSAYPGAGGGVWPNHSAPRTQTKPQGWAWWSSLGLGHVTPSSSIWAKEMSFAPRTPLIRENS